MKLTIKALLALLALSVFGEVQSLSHTEQITCLSSAQSRCRVSIGTSDRSNRIFALKVGERMDFDLMAREKRRCWGSACSAATVYRWPEYDHGRATPFAYGNYEQVLHYVHTRQEVHSPTGETAGLSDSAAIPHAPSWTERHTCVEDSCGVYYGSEDTEPYVYRTEIPAGTTLVYDLNAKTLQRCQGAFCVPFADFHNGRTSPVLSIQNRIDDPGVLITTRRMVRIIEAVEGGGIVQGSDSAKGTL